jgi:hypothetical protein
MKRIFTLFCVCATLAAGVCAQTSKPKPPAHGGKIETAYDGFAHETVVELKRMSVTCEMAKGAAGVAVKGVCVSLRAALHCPGRQFDYVRHVSLRLTFEAKNWDSRHTPNERQLSAVADGETLRLGRMTLLSNAVGEGWAEEDAKETLEVAVPYATFLKLARAASVEFSVGKTTFALREKSLAALRDLNTRVTLPQAPVQAGGGN